MTEEPIPEPKVAKPPVETWRTFLEETAPGVRTRVSGAWVVFTLPGGRQQYLLAKPDLMLRCSNQSCDGLRFFNRQSLHTGPKLASGEAVFLLYQCKNCQESVKLFVLLVESAPKEVGGAPAQSAVEKLAEAPPFGVRVPERVLGLFGDDRELFLKGRTAENKGLGIGAFTYYRRVLENQKARIVEAIIRVARHVNVPPDVLAQLEEARTAWRFDQAIDQIRDAIPESLRISGHNPLVLLHDALSGGVHDHSDEECLEIAGSIRVVLTDLAGRIERALEDKAELDTSVKRLMERTKAKGRPAKSDTEAPE